MKRPISLLIITIFFIGILLRLYRFDGPIADWHSWRQADTSSVSRIFADDGFDVLHPRYLDISNIQTGVNNPQGYRYVEFPLYNIFQAAAFKFIGILSIEQWGRIVTILSSLLCGLFLYLISRKYFGEKVAVFSLLFYMILPFSIYYGRTILPDTSMIMASFGGIYFFDRYLEEKKKSKFIFLFISTIFTAASFLLKPYAIFFVIPQIYLAFKKYNFSLFLKIELWLHLILSIFPFALWRIWILNFPEGVPASMWLLNGNGIRFRPAFFRWILFERLTKLILGYFGLIFLFLGLLKLKENKNYILVLSFLLSSILYVTVFATGNVQHDYYQILIVPSISILLGFGAASIFSKGLVYKVLGIFIFVLFWLSSYYQVKDYFNINNRSIVEAGNRANKILPKNAKVIAPLDGDTTLLYYINRPGWPAFQSGIEELKKLGATHMVILNPNENDLNGFGKQYNILDYSKSYLILDLK